MWITWWNCGLGETYSVTGHTGESKEIAAQLEAVEPNNWNAVNLAHIFGAIGNMDKAFEWLNYEPHQAFIAWAAVPAEYEPLRKDPRFKDFLARLNLPE